MANREDADYRMGAAELYRLNVERLKLTQTIQAEYGKWMIATLSLIHSGALYAIGSGNLGKGIPGAYVPSLVGLLLTLVSALLTWTNFSLAIKLFENWTNPRMLSDDESWPKFEGPLAFWINVTLGLAVGTGVAAGGCIIWAAVRLAP